MHNIYMKSKRAYGKKRYRKRVTRSGKSFTRKVQTVIRKTAEKKYVAFNSSAAGIDTGGLILRFTEVPQGDTDVTRDGDQLTIRSLQFNYVLTLADTTNVMRVILFQWFDSTQSVQPIPSNILIDTAIGRAVASPYSHDYRYQFKILYDKTHVLDSNTPVINRRVFLKRFPFKHKKIQYVGASSTNHNNGLFALVISDSAVGPNPTITYSGKFNFSDV